MKTPLLSTLVMLCTTPNVRPADWHTLVNAIGWVESGMDHRAIGDGGASRGAWQITRAAWQDVDRLRRSVGERTQPWKTGAHNPVHAHEIASNFLSLLNSRLSTKLGRPPTVQELYAAYNLGLDGFRRRRYLLERCPEVTRNGAIKVAAICQKL